MLDEGVIPPGVAERMNEGHVTAVEVMKLPVEEREALLASAAEFARKEYETNPDLTGFEGPVHAASARFPRFPGVLLADGVVLGYARNVALPSAMQLASPRPMLLSADMAMIDATCFPSGSDAFSDLCDCSFTLVVKISSHREMTFRDCHLEAGVRTYHPNSRFIEFGFIRIMVP
jgi:hypothetical protein